MSSPPIVEKPDDTPVTDHQDPEDPTWDKPNLPTHAHRVDQTETSCNNVVFAIFFYIALFSFIGVAASYGADALNPSTNSTDSVTELYRYHGFVYVTVLVSGLSFACAGLGMALLFCIPQFFIKVALIVTILLAAMWLVFYFVTGKIVGGILSALFLVIAVWYTYAVWARVPFATANLVTANTAIRANLGVMFYTIVFSFIGVCWAICWSVAYAGVSDATYSCDENNVCSDPKIGILIVLFAVFFFVQQVIQYSIHAIVAGAIATWWYTPEECGCCSATVNASFRRTMTTSFGSICFGSCFVAPIEITRDLVDTVWDEAELFGCIAEYISGTLATVLKYFNTWAFVYVGLYGMGYMKAGKTVLEVFENRGWGTVVTDNIVGNTLLLISLMVADFMSAVGLAIDANTDWFFHFGGNSNTVAFFLSFVVGLCISSIVLSCIGSSVNAVVVLYAEGPNEFEQNHPELSAKMRKVWNECYPGTVP